jgi:hypothetical protein
MKMPRAFTEQAATQRISLALRVGSLLKASPPSVSRWPWGRGIRKAERTGRRLAHSLNLHVTNFAALALAGVAPRNYHKNPLTVVSKNLWRKKAA